MPLSRSRRLVARVAIAAWLVYAVWLFAGWGDPATRHAVRGPVFLGFGMLAVVAAGATARRSRNPQRVAWLALTVGLTCWLGADAFTAGYPLVAGKPAPFPSVADVGYLALPVCICVMVLLSAERYRRSAIRLLLDGVIAASSVLLLSWAVVLGQLFERRRVSTFAFVVALAYPTLDLVVVTVGLLVLGWAQLPRRTSLLLLLVGIAAMAVSTDAYTHLIGPAGPARNAVFAVGWAASLLAFALAALYSRPMVRPDVSAARPPSRVVLWLPYVPLIPTCAVVIPKLPHVDPAEVSIGTALVSAVLIRQFLVIAENSKLLATVADQALRDPLTGLANRALFTDRLSHAVALRYRDVQPLAVLSIDLDNFKLVNDRLGHAAGDAVLVQAAHRIRSCVRTGDTVARLGGDEFAVLIEDGDRRAGQVAQRLGESFDEPFVVADHLLFIRPSVGLAVASDDNGGASADTLLKQSDAAMYAAKRIRTDDPHQLITKMPQGDPEELHLLNSSPHSSAQGGVSTRQLLGQLRRAIDRGELQLVYQPKVELRSGEVVGVEALVRWPHPDLGLLEPVQFLPLVRGHGLMDALTDVVLARACTDAADWRSRGHVLPVSVNLFAPSFADTDLPRRIWEALSASGLPPDCLTLEITEDLALGDLNETRAVLHRLRERGIRISIDDFGSGYSDLHYLLELPIDEVKLDQQFILPILDDPRATAIVRAMINLIHAMGFSCVAEGVADEATAQRLREFGCDMAQGYHYSAPVGRTVLLDMLTAPPVATAGDGSVGGDRVIGLSQRPVSP